VTLKIVLLAFIPLLCEGNPSPYFKGYTLQDLEVLAKQQNYHEFLKHAHDIRPSKRNKQWQKQLLQMALGHLKQTLKNQHFDQETIKEINKISSWPTLRDDEIFQLKMNDLKFALLKECFKKQSKNCSSKAFNLWEKSKLKTPELGFEMAKLLSEHQYTGDLFKLLKPATTGDMSEFYCHKPIIIRHLINKIRQVLLKGRPTQKAFATILNKACVQKVTPILKSGFINSSFPSLREEIFLFLDLFDAIKKNERDYFLTLYFLQAPLNGDVLNESWNTLKILGTNFKRRQKVLTKLKQFILLPDETFGLKDQKRANILIEHVAENIPEYLSFYAQTCLNYLKGIGKFPSGNPTLHCEKLFKKAEKTDWISWKTQKRYRQIKNL
jgi:hypothetical protein